MENRPAIVTVTVEGVGEASEVKIDFTGGTVPLPALMVALQMVLDKLGGMEPKPVDKKDIN